MDIPPKQQQHNSKEEDYWVKQLGAAKTLNWITGFSVGVAGAALLVLFWTLDSTRTAAKAALQSADTAKSALNMAERAYLDFHGAVLTKPIKEDMPVEMTINLDNRGHTPAREIETWLDLTLETSCPPSKPAQSYMRYGYLAPGAPIVHALNTQPLIVDEAKEVLTPDLVLKRGEIIANAHRLLCLHGRATYKDVFGGDNAVSVCVAYNAIVSKFAACLKGNEMTLPEDKK